MISCQNSDDETLPWTKTTVCSGPVAESSAARWSTLTLSRPVSIRREVMPSKRVMGVLRVTRIRSGTDALRL